MCFSEIKWFLRDCSWIKFSSMINVWIISLAEARGGTYWKWWTVALRWPRISANCTCQASSELSHVVSFRFSLLYVLYHTTYIFNKFCLHNHLISCRNVHNCKRQFYIIRPHGIYLWLYRLPSHFLFLRKKISKGF